MGSYTDPQTVFPRWIMVLIAAIPGMIIGSTMGLYLQSPVFTLIFTTIGATISSSLIYYGVTYKQKIEPKVIAKVPAAAAGAITGAAVGALIGSLFTPGIGTAIGAAIGALVGVIAGGSYISFITRNVDDELKVTLAISSALAAISGTFIGGFIGYMFIPFPIIGEIIGAAILSTTLVLLVPLAARTINHIKSEKIKNPLALRVGAMSAVSGAILGMTIGMAVAGLVPGVNFIDEVGGAAIGVVLGAIISGAIGYFSAKKFAPSNGKLMPRMVGAAGAVFGAKYGSLIGAAIGGIIVAEFFPGFGVMEGAMLGAAIGTIVVAAVVGVGGVLVANGYQSAKEKQNLYDERAVTDEPGFRSDVRKPIIYSKGRGDVKKFGGFAEELKELCRKLGFA